MSTQSPIDPCLATAAIHGAGGVDPVTGAILTPIHQATTYVQDGVGLDRGHTYSRASNPTVSALERALGALEDAPAAVAYGTGMAAIAGLLLTVCKQGDHVVCGDVVYGGTVRFLREILADLGVSATFCDTTDAEALAAAIRPETVIALVESPANPTLVLTDIAACAEICRSRGVLLAVDNTFLTAALQPCLPLGADIVVYSTTKYLEGHNATVGGAVLTRDEALITRLRRVRKTLGSIQKPFDAWLTLRGLKTLKLRLEGHSANALAVARYLESHELVSRVSYPGLPSHPQYELACRQQRSGGGMLAFEVVGGAPAARKLMASLELVALAENLGAVESLITHPASMTHGDVPDADRERTGITDGLVRLSVGLEDPAAITADLGRALELAHDAALV